MARVTYLKVVAAATAALALVGATAGSSSPSGVFTAMDVGQYRHSAFPGLTEADGDRVLVWRHGADHVDSRDGRVHIARSNGDGFGRPSMIRMGKDLRDPSVSYIKGKLWLTFFRATDREPAQGALVQREWQPPKRLDDLPLAAITAPVVKLPNGDLGAVYYGRARGERTFSAWFARSRNGRDWQSTRIAHGQRDGRAYSEPWMVVRGDTVHVLHRWGGWNAIGITSSHDGGRTWRAPRRILVEATGRPSTLVFESGTMAVVYRHTRTRDAMLATSADNGRTWVAEGVLMAAPDGSPLGMTYAAMVETAAGTAQVVLGMEQPDGTSDLYTAEITVE